MTHLTYSIQARETEAFGWAALCFSNADGFYRASRLRDGFASPEAAIEHTIAQLAAERPDAAALHTVQVRYLDDGFTPRWETRSIFA